MEPEIVTAILRILTGMSIHGQANPNRAKRLRLISQNIIAYLKGPKEKYNLHYGVLTSMLKHEIKNIIIPFLVDEEDFLIFFSYISYYGLTNRPTVERVRILKAIRIRKKIKSEFEERRRADKEEREER